MKVYRRSVGAIACGLLLGIVTAGAASAQLSKVDQKCRGSIAKGFAKALATADKVSTGCHKSRDGGKIPDTTDCNDLSPAQADAKGKFGKAQDKLEDGIQKKCTDAGASASLLTNYISCPEPCGTDLALPNPLTTFSEVGQCLACYAGALVEARNAITLDTPTEPLSKEEGKCHGAIGKGYGKHLSTIVKERQKCQKGEDKSGNNELSPCDTSDAKGKIQKAQDKADGGLDKSCTGVNLTNLGSCSDVDLASLKTCLVAEDDDAGMKGFAAGYELAPTICPSRVDSKVVAGVGTGGVIGRSSLETGWTGISHDADLPDNYFLSADISCPASPPCGACTVTGVSSSGPQYATFTRCRDDFSVKCSNPFGTDGACGGGDCVYILGPPLPISSGNNPVCSVNILTQDVTGTVNPEAGSSELNIDLSSLVYTGIITEPCPVCIGDTTPQDGVRDTGVCRGGGRDGLACDVDAFDETFAPAGDGKGLALDCPPSIGNNITGSGLTIPIEFTTGMQSLAFENVCDAPLNFLDCACGVCNGNTLIPCKNDQECSDIGAGTCTSKGSGANRQPNGCDQVAGGAACTDLGGGKGECNGGSPDQVRFCDGVQRANGNGFVLCNTNADCANTACNPDMPAQLGCGDCTDVATKPCFLDPVVGQGEADVENPLLVSTFCIPPTNSASVNNTAGLPGPARVQADMFTTLVY